jgi:hypothetical protein
MLEDPKISALKVAEHRVGLVEGSLSVERHKEGVSGFTAMLRMQSSGLLKMAVSITWCHIAEDRRCK